MRQYEVEWIDAAGKHRRFVAAAGTERAARELFRRYCGAAAGGTVLLVQEVAAAERRRSVLDRIGAAEHVSPVLTALPVPQR